MSEENNGGQEPDNQPEGADNFEAPEAKVDDLDLGPDFDRDFPSYANEANKELNNKVRCVTYNN